ncbi:MAG: DUF3108 domain-containing protein [Cytophagales bacterium]|nr:MAG: DUF3108 domain-containing protein [Cytophagales bacterium]
MKNSILAFTLFFLMSSFIIISDDKNYRTVKHNGFTRGEKLTYLVHYGFINAGEATVEMNKELHTLNDRPCYRVEIKGKTIGLITTTFDVDDSWISYIDTLAVIPHQFARKIKENNYRKEEVTFFDHIRKKATVKSVTGTDPEVKKDFSVPANVQDMVSGYYFLRTLDFDKYKAKDTIVIDGFFEEKVYSLKVVYKGKEKLQTKFGRIQTAVLSPIMPENALFDGRDAIRFYVSDDPNRVPIKIEARMFVGAIELDLIDHKGLVSKFRKK